MQENYTLASSEASFNHMVRFSDDPARFGFQTAWIEWRTVISDDESSNTLDVIHPVVL